MPSMLETPPGPDVEEEDGEEMDRVEAAKRLAAAVKSADAEAILTELDLLTLGGGG